MLWLLYENIGSSISFGGAFGNPEFLTPEEEEEEREEWPGFGLFSSANGDGVDQFEESTVTWVGRKPEEVIRDLTERQKYGHDGEPLHSTSLD